MEGRYLAARYALYGLPAKGGEGGNSLVIEESTKREKRRGNREDQVRRSFGK